MTPETFLAELDANNRPLLLKANDIHQMFRMSFRVDLSRRSANWLAGLRPI